jgi:transcriptional regulator with XRE-family HTH domain
MKFGTHKKPHDFLMDLALRHKALRKQNALSQQQLALRSGVSLGSIKRFEATGQISLESLLKLAYVLNRLADFDLLLVPNDQHQAIEHLFSDKTRS